MNEQPISDEHRELMPSVPNQTTIWDAIRYADDGPDAPNPFRRDPEEEARRRKLAQHKLWLESIPHECPSPYAHYRIGIYIRYFNQTKYENYLDYHKQTFIDTVGLCPNWKIVDFYVDEGQSAPNMESAKDWCRLLDDCFAGRIDLIITQKVSNVSRDPDEITFVSRILAAQPHPIGIYFISEDLFTLASYYRNDLHEKGFLPSGSWRLLPDEASIPETNSTVQDALAQLDESRIDSMSESEAPALPDGDEWADDDTRVERNDAPHHE